MTHAYFQPNAVATACEAAMAKQPLNPFIQIRIRSLAGLAQASVKAATDFGIGPQSMALSMEDYELLREHL